MTRATTKMLKGKITEKNRGNHHLRAQLGEVP